MLFTSYGFIGLLIILFILYYTVPKKLQMPLLLITSLTYYAMADVRFLIFIGVSVVTVWFGAIKIEDNNKAIKEYVKLHKNEMSVDEKKAYKKAGARKSVIFFTLTLLLNLGILATVKLAGLKFTGILIPLGISFYTFQSVGYLIDVYRESIDAQRSLPRYALFITFFPQLIQGPINRYDDLAPSLLSEHNFDFSVFSRGMERILWGYFKKLVIADRLLMGVSTLISDPSTYKGGYVLMTLILYTLELYADFTGGIDITIGIAEALGINMKENFIRPYFSTSLADYWRRWHISMCSWFRDYVFYPMSTSSLSLRLSKWARKHISDSAGGKLPVYLSSFVVWFCTGIWHGTTINFIVWGMLNFLVLTISEELSPAYKKFHERFAFADGPIYKAFMIIRTFILVCVLNLFDCFVDVRDTVGLLISIFKKGSFSLMEKGALLNIGLSAADYIVAGVALIIVFIVSSSEEKDNISVRDKLRKNPYPVRFIVWTLLLTATLIFGIYGIGYDSSQFIYNRF
ncbi:MAG: MBOAT family protein [Lachnospiraceae bacterium]|nr:MBOAT family protein [Lachnospiraceae bacterium]